MEDFNDENTKRKKPEKYTGKYNKSHTMEL